MWLKKFQIKKKKKNFQIWWKTIYRSKKLNKPQNKHKEILARHIIAKMLTIRKKKTKRKSWKQQRKNDSTCTRGKTIWLVLTSHQRQWRPEGSGIMYLRCWNKREKTSIYEEFYSHKTMLQKWNWGNSLEVQWLGLQALTAEGPGSIPGQGTKIPQSHKPHDAAKKKKRNRYKDILRLTNTQSICW